MGLSEKQILKLNESEAESKIKGEGYKRECARLQGELTQAYKDQDKLEGLFKELDDEQGLGTDQVPQTAVSEARAREEAVLERRRLRGEMSLPTRLVSVGGGD